MDPALYAPRPAYYAQEAYYPYERPRSCPPAYYNKGYPHPAEHLAQLPSQHEAQYYAHPSRTGTPTDAPSQYSSYSRPGSPADHEQPQLQQHVAPQYQRPHGAKLELPHGHPHATMRANAILPTPPYSPNTHNHPNIQQHPHHQQQQQYPAQQQWSHPRQLAGKTTHGSAPPSPRGAHHSGPSPPWTPRPTTPADRSAAGSPVPGSGVYANQELRIRRGITTITEVITQFEVGEPGCPPLRDWSVEMRRRERSIYSQRKKLYEEYQRLGSVAAFNREYKNMSIGKIYALISSRSRNERGLPVPRVRGLRSYIQHATDADSPPPAIAILRGDE